LQALRLHEKANDRLGIAMCNISIGNIYSEQEDYKSCIPYYINTKNISEAIHDDGTLLISLINLGDTYEKLNRLDSARAYTRQAYELAVRLNNIENRGICLNNLGNIHSKMGDSNIAMEYYRQSIIDNTSENNDDVNCETMLGMARLFQKDGETDSALYYARQTLSVAEQGGFTKHILNTSNFLSALYESIHLVDSAYAYQKITIAAKDSLFSQEKIKEVQNLRFAEQVRQQEIAAANELAIEAKKKYSNGRHWCIHSGILWSYFVAKQKKDEAQNHRVHGAHRFVALV
jgi:two-component system NtrC family sensor kinase